MATSSYGEGGCGDGVNKKGSRRTVHRQQQGQGEKQAQNLSTNKQS